MKEYSFEKLESWKIARSFVSRLYFITGSFPESEKFGIINQIRRAGISITSNLAEGTSRNSYKEKVRFIEISFSSLMEVLNCLIISNDCGWINDNDLEGLRNDIDNITYKLIGLKNSYIKKID